MSSPRAILRTVSLAVALTIVPLLSCQPSDNAWREAPSIESLPKLACGVTIQSKSGPVDVQAVLAITPNETARGLMFRDEPLGDNKGMLFILRKEQNQVFHMKNTFIPLDMIFINDAQEIVGIVEKAQPRSLDKRQVNAPSRYVLEVDGGWCARHGVQAGQRVQFQAHPND